MGTQSEYFQNESRTSGDGFFRKQCFSAILTLISAQLFGPVNPAVRPYGTPAAWNVKVKPEDLSITHRLGGFTLDVNRATLKTFGNVDDEVGQLVFPSLVSVIACTPTDRSLLHNTVNKSTFLRSLVRVF